MLPDTCKSKAAYEGWGENGGNKSMILTTGQKPKKKSKSFCCQRLREVCFGLSIIFAFRQAIAQISSSGLSADGDWGAGRGKRMLYEIDKTFIPPLTNANNYTNSFSLEDELDFTTPIDCGFNKCFFHSSTSPNIGYLVARMSGGDQDETINNMKKAWNSVQDLEEKLRSVGVNTHNSTTVPSFRHFLAGPPIESIEITDDKTLQKMNDLASHWWMDKDGQRPNIVNYYGRRTVSFNHRVMVQRVWVAPNPSLTIFCDGYKSRRTKQQLLKFLSSVNRNDFLSTFDQEWQHLISEDDESNNRHATTLLQLEPRLWFDFQILVDNHGQIYHIDLDRSPKILPQETEETRNKKYSKWKRRMTKSCNAIIDHVRQSIEDGSQDY